MLFRGPSSSCVARPAGLPSQASRAAVRAPLAPRAPLVAARPASSLPFASSRSSKLFAISKPTDAAEAAQSEPIISIDNGADSSTTVVRVAGSNRPGLLTALTAAFRDLGLDVKKVRRGGRKIKKFLLFPPSATPTSSVAIILFFFFLTQLSLKKRSSNSPRPRSDLPTAPLTTRSTSRW